MVNIIAVTKRPVYIAASKECLKRIQIIYIIRINISLAILSEILILIG